MKKGNNISISLNTKQSEIYILSSAARSPSLISNEKNEHIQFDNVCLRGHNKQLYKEYMVMILKVEQYV